MDQIHPAEATEVGGGLYLAHGRALGQPATDPAWPKEHRARSALARSRRDTVAHQRHRLHGAAVPHRVVASPHPHLLGRDPRCVGVDEDLRRVRRALHRALPAVRRPPDAHLYRRGVPPRASAHLHGHRHGPGRALSLPLVRHDVGRAPGRQIAALHRHGAHDAVRSSCTSA